MKELKELVGRSFFVVPMFEEVWIEAFSSYFEQKNSYKSLILLFPLLEHSVRRIYATSNNCGSKMLTASTSTLYTTLDTLMSPLLQGSETEPNKIFDILGNDTTMNALFDILIWMEGPRIRDLLAHGVVDIENISPIQVQYIIAISISILIQFDCNNYGKGIIIFYFLYFLLFYFYFPFLSVYFYFIFF